MACKFELKGYLGTGSGSNPDRFRHSKVCVGGQNFASNDFLLSGSIAIVASISVKAIVGKFRNIHRELT